MDGTFGVLLALHRRAAGLTQEELADRAQLSAAAVSALERGIRTSPRRYTLTALADALGLTGDERIALLGTAPRRTGPAVGRTTARPAPVTPRQLPHTPADFTGRAEAVRTLSAELTAAGPATVVAITGMPGVGKSALATRVAHLVADRFPDGQLYLNLRGAGPAEPMRPREALNHLLRGLGVFGADLPLDADGAGARFRTLAAERRLLVVLDDAVDVQQVVPLLPAGPRTAVLVTSRRELSGLPGARTLQLGVLEPAESIDLLRRIAGPDRIDAEPGAAVAVTAACGRLPLAVRIAGARLAGRADWPVSYLAARLTGPAGLSELVRDDLAVRASFEVSIDQLAGSADETDRQAASAFVVLGLTDGPDLTSPVAARLLDVPEHEAGLLLERLCDLCLLDAVEPDRYRMHDLLRDYARELAAGQLSAADRAAAIERLLALYTAVAWRTCPADGARRRWAGEQWIAGGPAFADDAEAMVWLDGQRPHLIAAIEQAVSTPGLDPELGVRLALGLFMFYATRGHWLDCARIYETTLEVAAAGPDRLAEALLRHDLGLTYADLALGGAARLGSAVDQFLAARAIFEQAGAIALAAMCSTNLSHALGAAGEIGAAIGHAEHGLALCERTADRRGIAVACLNLGELHARNGADAVSLGYLERARAEYEELADSAGLAACLLELGLAEVRRHRIPAARERLEASVRTFEGSGDRQGHASALEELGALHAGTGDHAAAVAALSQSLQLARDCGDGTREERVSGLLRGLDQPDQDRRRA